MMIKMKKVYLVLFFSLIAFIFTLPIFKNFDNWGIHDWDYDFVKHAIPRTTMLRFHQIPLWNPWLSGGTVSLANPQSKFLSPFFIIIILFDVVHGIKIQIWVNLVIGLIGTYCLARHYKLGKIPAVFSSSVFMLSTAYSLPISVGMTTFMAMVYIPWLFLFFLKSFSCLKYILLAALVFLLMFFGGGIHLFAVSWIMLASYSLFLALFKKQSWQQIIKVLGGILILVILLGAVKFLPLLEFTNQYSRKTDEWSGYSLPSFSHSLLSRDQSLISIKKFPEGGNLFFGANYGMAENGMYIGIIPLLFSLVGLRFYYRKKLPLTLALLAMLWISFGNRTLISLWELVHLLPLYNSTRTPQRFRFAFLFCLAIFAGFGFQKVNYHISKRLKKKKISKLLSLLILALIILDLTIVSRPVLKSGFTIPPIKVEKSPDFHQVWRLPSYGPSGWGKSNTDLMYRSLSSLYPTFLSNRGTIHAYEPIPLPQNPTPVDSDQYKGEVYLEGTEGKVYFKEWTPNKLKINVSAKQRGYLILNQNYYSGWKVKGKKGLKVESIKGLLAVKISPADKEVELYYLPTSFIIGLIVSSTTLLLIIAFLLCSKTHRKKSYHRL